ncbi:MAG: glutaredoxin 3 [Myxococcota bacterium]
MTRIELYTKAWCPYCHAAKKLLERRGLAYDEIDLTDDPVREREMIDRARRKSVPQVFVDDVHVGGFDDLAALDREGGLDRAIEAGGAPLSEQARALH